MKTLAKIATVVSISFLLSGCFLTAALSALGGGTTSKGHGNDNVVLVGSDQSNGLSTGGKTDVDAENVGGDVTGRDKHNTSVTGSEQVNIVNYPDAFVYGIIIIMLIGWLLPTPTVMYIAFINMIRRKK